MAHLLDIRNLSIDFATPGGVVHAVRGVHLQVPKKATVGIVGESGCGKSTIASSVLRLLASNARVVSGSITLCGRDVLQLDEEVLRAMRGSQAAMIFQDPMTAQNPVISILKQMIDIQYREASLSRREKKDRAIEMLRRVAIPDPDTRIHDFAHQFSGGMRQRISIAMALLARPELLIADEPTTALDVSTEAQIAFLLRELQQQLGLGMLFISHNLGLVAEVCDEVVVMYAGEVVERGSVRDLFCRPKHPYTQRLLECDPALVRRRTRLLPVIPGRVPDLRSLPKGCVFQPRCEKALPVCAQRPAGAHALSASHQASCHLLSAESASAPALRACEGDRASLPGAQPPDSVGGVGNTGGPLLAIRHLQVRFRTDGFVKALIRRNRDPYLDAVLDCSLDLREGEALGVVGESGSGKTTLGRSILGLVRPQGGSIRFEGAELVGLANSEYNRHRRKIAIMFQDPVASLSPRQTARALVLEPFEIHRIALADRDAVAAELFGLVGLSPAYFDRYPHELSGGQARRIGVARALALSPRLIVADEPTAGLDVSVQGEILNLMRQLQSQKGLSYLVISHNLPAIRHVCDRIAVFYLGRLIEEGPVAEIFARPAHPYTKALVEGIPQPDPDRRRSRLPIEGEVPSLAQRPRGCEFHGRCAFASPLCRQEIPLDRPVAQDRRVSCHFPLA